ncbi:MAG: PKD domain-containing protein [Candidatus Micrarchaeia archaeon]
MKNEMMAFALAVAVLAGFAYADNAAPVIISLTGQGSVQATETGTWEAYAYDPEAQQISFAIAWGDGYTVSGITQNHFYHVYSQPGEYTLAVTASDPLGASSQQTKQITVTSAPEPLCPGYPTLHSYENLTVGSYTLRFDSLLSIMTMEGYYTLFHGPNTVGTFEIASNNTTYVSMPNGDILAIDVCQSFMGFTLGSMESHVKFSVNGSAGQPPLLNLPPVIAGVSGSTILLANEQGTWNIGAFDPDGTYLSYSVQWGDKASYNSSALSSAQIGSAATLQHEYSQAGNYTITFTVTDSEGASAQATRKATVIPDPNPVACPEHRWLHIGENITLGEYSLIFHGIGVAFGKANIHPSSFEILQNQFPLGTISVNNIAVHFDAPNGDQLTIDVCDYILGGSISKVKFSVVGAPPAAECPPAPPRPPCDDGTMEGECSATKPMMCVNGMLTGNAVQCGCPAGEYAVGTQCTESAVPLAPVAASPGGAAAAPAAPIAKEPATPLPAQPDKLDQIIALLGQIRDLLFGIFGK